MRKNPFFLIWIMLFMVSPNMTCLCFVQQNLEHDLAEEFKWLQAEAMVVTASKRIQKISDAPSIISVIGRNDIEKMAATSLIDVLRYIPAIETSMGPTGAYRVAIRGIRKDGNILLMIDGHHFNDFYDGSAVFDLPTEFIDRIEVIRGPGSALFGTNAVAGLINIITLKTPEKFLKLSAGTNATYSGDVHYGKETDKYHFYIASGYMQTDGANNTITEDAAESETTAPNWDLAYGDKSADTDRWVKNFYIQTNRNTIIYPFPYLDCIGIRAHGQAPCTSSRRIRNISIRS